MVGPFHDVVKLVRVRPGAQVLARRAVAPVALRQSHVVAGRVDLLAVRKRPEEGAVVAAKVRRARLAAALLPDWFRRPLARVAPPSARAAEKPVAALIRGGAHLAHIVDVAHEGRGGEDLQEEEAERSEDKCHTVGGDPIGIACDWHPAQTYVRCALVQ